MSALPPLDLPPVTSWFLRTDVAHPAADCGLHAACVLAAAATTTEDHLDLVSQHLTDVDSTLTGDLATPATSGRDALAVLDALALALLDAADSPAATAEPTCAPTPPTQGADHPRRDLCLVHLSCTLQTGSALVAWTARLIARRLATSAPNAVAEEGSALADDLGRQVHRLLLGHAVTRLRRLEVPPTPSQGPRA